MFSKRARNPLILAAVGVVLFFTNLGATRLWDVDEAIFSAASREMFERQDLIVPYFNGKVFAHKPPLLFWFQMAAYQLFGPTEFAARFWSAAFGVGNMLLACSLGSMLFGRRAGFWSGLVLGSCVNFAVIARAATPDSFLVFFCTLSFWVLVWGTFERDADDEAAPWRPTLPVCWSTYALAYAAMGVAVLVKGPVGVVLPTAVWGLFLLFEQRHQRALAADPAAPPPRGLGILLSLLGALHPFYVLHTIWRMRPLTALAMVLLVAGPWYAWVGLATDGQFLEEFFGVHNFGRFTSPMENHRGPIFYYLPAVLLGTFPWCILLGPTLVHMLGVVRTRGPARSGVVLATAWVAVWVGFFSLASTKLPSYVVPAYPALALLCGAAIDKWLAAKPNTSRAWLRAAFAICALVGVLILVAVPLATAHFLAGEVTPALVGLVLVTGAGVGFLLSEFGRLRLSLVSLAATSVVFCTWLLGFSVLPIDAHQNSDDFAAIIRANTQGKEPHVGAFRYLPPSLVFYNRRPVAGLWNTESALAHFEEHPRDAFVFTTEENYLRLANRLPHDVRVIATSKRFLRRGQLVLLGREADSPAALSANAGATPVRLEPAPR